MAKRISELPTAVNADGMRLTGTQGGITKQIPAYKVGEQWEDITALFTPSSGDAHYRLYKSGFPETSDIPLRITIELSTSFFDTYYATGTIQLYVTPKIGVPKTVLLTNTIFEDSDETFTGRLSISPSWVTYEFGVDITDEEARPKILKVERLVENE